MNDAGCTTEQGCISCGDTAISMTVLEVSGSDASCRDLNAGRDEWVAVELVGDVCPGDLLLVHAGVAIERLRKG